MTISFTLNRKPVSLDAPAEKRLVDILREDFSLKANRPGCYAGVCGTCAVFVDGELAYACMIPVFAVQDREVLTYEGLKGTADFDDIVEGFEAAGSSPCANCRQSRFLSAYALLASNPVPGRDEINDFFGGNHCRCTSMHQIYNAIDHIITYRRFGRRGRE